MASFTLAPDPRFHVGATVYCYLGGGPTPVQVSPVTSSVVASGSTTTFTGLSDDTAYLAGLAVTGPFISFRTAAAASSSGGGSGGGGGDVAVVIYDGGWAARPDAPMVIWNGGDVTTPPTVGGEDGALDGIDWWVPSSGEGA